MRLDDSQKRAVRYCLKRRIGVVQGPPRTGKTIFGNAVLIILIFLITKNVETKILLTASSNSAVDNLLQRFRGDKDKLLQSCDAVGLFSCDIIRRYGTHLAPGFEKLLEDIHLDKRCRRIGEDGVSWTDEGQYKEETEASYVLGGTLGSLALGRTIPAQRFSTTLLEENGQTWPVDKIQALLRSERAFLIGDHKLLIKMRGRSNFNGLDLLRA